MTTKTAPRVETNKKADDCIDNPVGWVEIPAEDLKRAQDFYGQVFGFKFQTTEMLGFKMAMFPMMPDGKGSSGALMQGGGYTPSHEGSMVYFSVLDIQETEKKIRESGGEVLKPKTSIGPYGFISIFQDSEGNRVALHSRT